MNVASLPVAAQPPEVTQQPTVGRIVHFFKSARSPASARTMDSNGPFAALVTAVDVATNSITLRVFPPLGEPYGMHGVRHRDASSPGSRFWEWPPR